MRKRYKRWEKLDNTANLFPVIAGENMSNTYRLAVVLKEPIQKELLQRALDEVLPRVPGFRLRLRSGFFWYYLEENDKPAPRVEEEHTYPCRFIHTNQNNSFLFRVTYYGCRINLEVFHVLADGTGGMAFLRELTYAYLRLAHPDLRDKVGDGLSDETSLNREDSFLRNYKKASKSMYQSKRAFLIKGEKLAYHGFGIIHGHISVSAMRRYCKEHGVSINEYIVAAFTYSTYKAYQRKVSEKRPIRVAVPVNLRPFFNSITTKNFLVMVSSEFAPQKDDYTFEEILSITHDCLSSQITRENLEAIFSYNVSNEQYLFARAVPLPLKNIAMKLIYTRNALANTTTITNMGRATVAEEYDPYIEGFHCFLSFSKGQGLKCGVASFHDDLVISFVTELEDTAVQMGVFRQMQRDGLDVSIETNGVFYE